MLHTQDRIIYYSKKSAKAAATGYFALVIRSIFPTFIINTVLLMNIVSINIDLLMNIVFINIEWGGGGGFLILNM